MILIYSSNYRYARQKISLEDENDDPTKTSLEKDRNVKDNNNIECQENLNKPSTPQCASEKFPTEEKEWSPSSDSASSVQDDQVGPRKEKLKKSDEK